MTNFDSVSSKEGVGEEKVNQLPNAFKVMKESTKKRNRDIYEDDETKCLLKVLSKDFMS